MGWLHRHRGLVPYLLLAPGLAWLALFFVVPIYYLASTSLQTGSLDLANPINNLGPLQLDVMAPFTRFTPMGGTALSVALTNALPNPGQACFVRANGSKVHCLAWGCNTTLAMTGGQWPTEPRGASTSSSST